MIGSAVGKWLPNVEAFRPDYALWPTASRGRITAAQIAVDVALEAMQ
jgi:hypothetical protein